ncbi:N-acetyl-gamma-glutamyl-phosphate reductase [Haloglycomyces albus]|uniref:N-acetyl-gamma-glutamyl-phosphate reductase n=1 Tax=Haloglycomyces albus TaxID=526067 RepID=UPI00046CBACC|nr:N-acetyl-gamma-glutamyl-phosphate reductase [Haloglycomyces albus]
MTYRIAVAGASGYAGGEALRLICDHPELELACATAHTQAGQALTEVHPHLPGLSERYFDSTGSETIQAARPDAVVMTLPHGQSAALAAELPDDLAIVDLGADHRLVDADQWAKYYSGPHAGSWTYGLPELPGQRERIQASTRVAATGCYAVATILALAPLLHSGIAQKHDVVTVAASGTTGAGNNPVKRLLASEVTGSLTGYKTGRHQHVPEIKQATGATGLSLTPVLAPMPRGILATVTALPATPDIDADDVRDLLLTTYKDEPFVHVVPEGAQPSTKAVLGTNSAQLQATVDADSGRLIVTSAVDNLGKGASGQVVQCLNLLLGLPETTGLTVNGIAP